MIFPSILFWVWMAAQQPSCHTISQTDRSIHSGCGNFESKSWTQTSPEHVIEIRTKHETAKVIEERDDISRRLFCPDGFEFHTTFVSGVVGYGKEEHSCERVTREVWIDGKRWGVLKESGQ